MSQEITGMLQELATGQKEILARVAGLEGKFDSLEGKFDSLEGKVVALSEDFEQHRKGTNDNFELILALLKAMKQTPNAGGDPPSTSRFASSR